MKSNKTPALIRRQPSALSIAIALALIPAAPSRADDAEGQMRKFDAMQVTASRRSELVTEVAQGVTVVSSEDLQYSVTPMEALRGQTGTYFQSTTPGQSVIIVRGLKGSEVLHLVDGFRLNSAIFRNAPNQYVALVDGQALDRIEVVRGPSSTLYGSDAMGGVVQMFTTSPRFNDQEWRNEGRLRSFYNSADDSWTSRVSASGGRDGLALSAGLTYQDVNEREVGGGDEIPFTNYRSEAGDAKLSWTVAPGHELSLSYQYLSQPSTPRIDELVPGFGQTEATSDVFAFEPQERRFGQIVYRGEVSTALFDNLELHLGEQRITDDRRSRDRGSVNLDTEQNESELFGFSAQFNKDFGAHYLSYGGEYYSDEVSAARQRTNINTGVRVDRAARFPDGSTQDSFGLYIVDDYKPHENLDLNFGLRYSQVEVDLPPVIGGLGVEIDESATSGHFGVSYGLNDSLNLVGSYARGFRAPNIFDLGTFGDRPGNRFNLPNPDLQPETVDTFDLGLKWSSPQIEAELIAFHSDYQDKITSVLTGELTPNGREIVQNRNVTDLKLWGVEAGLRYYPGESTTVSASATYTRGDEELDGDEYPADRIPPLFGRVGIEHRLNESLRLEAYSLFATAQDRLSPRDEQDPRINPNGSAGWTTLNARAQWAVNPDLVFALSLLNMTDQRYREHGSGLDAAGRGALISVDWAIR